MGTIDLSKLTGLSGRIGPIVTYITKGGKQAFRVYVKPNNPRSPKQVAHRAKFALVNRALSPLNKVIKRGYRHDKNAYRTLISKAFREAVTGDYPHFSVDFSKIQIAVGKLQLPADIRLRFDRLSGMATFSWNPHLAWPSQPGSDNDRVHIVYFNTGNPLEVKTFSRGTRADGEASVELSGERQPDITHFWIYFTSHDLQDNSNSIYLACNPPSDANNPTNVTKT